MTEKPLVINLTTNQEYKLRLEYVNSQQFDDSYNGYKSYALHNVPGVVEVKYRHDDHPDYISSLTFLDDKYLSWFLLKYT